MKLHLGCGDKHIDGFVNVDIRTMKGVDVVADIKTLGFFGKESADLIYASHVLEHMGRHEYMDVLKVWHSILKPEGILRIAVPDFSQIVKEYIKHADLRSLRGLLYGGQTYSENYHYCAWDFSTLKDDLFKAGFTSVWEYNWKNTEHAHVDDYSQSYLPHLQKETGRLMSLNVEALK